MMATRCPSSGRASRQGKGPRHSGIVARYRLNEGHGAYHTLSGGNRGPFTWMSSTGGEASAGGSVFAVPVYGAGVTPDGRLADWGCHTPSPACRPAFSAGCYLLSCKCCNGCRLLVARRVYELEGFRDGREHGSRRSELILQQSGKGSDGMDGCR